MISKKVGHIIRVHYISSGKVVPPDADTAVAWAITEIAEAIELLLDRKEDWVRNNPGDKETYTPARLAEELGDAIMMLLVAGYVEDLDPLQAMIDKLSHADTTSD